MLDLNAPLRTLDGAPVRIVCADRRSPSMPIVALALKGDHEFVLCINREGWCTEPAPGWQGEYLEENPHRVVNGAARDHRRGHVHVRMLARDAHPDRRLIDLRRPIRTRTGSLGGAGNPVRIVCSDRIGDKPLVGLYNDGSGEGVVTARMDGSVWSRDVVESDPGPGPLDLVNVEPGSGDRQRVLVRAEFEMLLAPGEAVEQGQAASHALIEQRLRNRADASFQQSGQFLPNGPRVVQIVPVRWESHS